MSKTITIDPVTRIEGHAKITIYLDDAGEVSNARFHVTEFRGFEKFCEGRPFWEMAGITPRICGICPISHLLASAKAGDRILAVTLPPSAEKLRRLMNLGQIMQSHALSFFHLSSPDFLLGWDSDPAQRNVFGLIAAEPELAKGGIYLRKLGQEIIGHLGGQKIHPAWAVPGGVRQGLSPEGQAYIRAGLPQATTVVLQALTLLNQILVKMDTGNTTMACCGLSIVAATSSPINLIPAITPTILARPSSPIPISNPPTIVPWGIPIRPRLAA
jgi:NAD-reducing hydrogenase large subunit